MTFGYQWGGSNLVDPSVRLLFWTLWYVLEPYFDEPIDHWLKDILSGPKGLGGDPGWDIDYVLGAHGTNNYHVWTDPEISGLEPNAATYTVEIFCQAVKESLLAMGQKYSQKGSEIAEVIWRYKL